MGDDVDDDVGDDDDDGGGGGDDDDVGDDDDLVMMVMIMMTTATTSGCSRMISTIWGALCIIVERNPKEGFVAAHLRPRSELA